MQQLPLATIRTRALELHTSGETWHFHVLTPSCKLNDRDLYAFVLEHPASHEVFAYYSEQAEKELGVELSPLLHGADILDKTGNTTYIPSEIITKMTNRAQQLNEASVEWHHHLLFPDCQFNPNPSRFTLVFEDPETKEMLVSISDKEPSNDLKQLERLFYKSN